jgi:hypothetical protein
MTRVYNIPWVTTEGAVTGLPKDKLASLRAEIDQQRNTIEALKRDGHECTDAERASCRKCLQNSDEREDPSANVRPLNWPFFRL